MKSLKEIARLQSFVATAYSTMSHKPSEDECETLINELFAASGAHIDHVSTATSAEALAFHVAMGEKYFEAIGMNILAKNFGVEVLDEEWSLVSLRASQVNEDMLPYYFEQLAVYLIADKTAQIA